MIWRKANENHSRLPAPTAFGWTSDVGSSHFSPVRCLNPLAPEAVLYTIKCRCNSGCEGKLSQKTISHAQKFVDVGFSLATTIQGQPVINEECEDDWCTLLKLHLYTSCDFLHLFGHNTTEQ